MVLKAPNPITPMAWDKSALMIVMGWRNLLTKTTNISIRNARYHDKIICRHDRYKHDTYDKHEFHWCIYQANMIDTTSIYLKHHKSV